MTRKSRVCWQVEAFEPKVLLSAVRGVPQVPAVIAPVMAYPRTILPPDATTPTTTTSPSAAVVSNTVGDPRAPVVNALDGTYGHAGRSLSVKAEGSVAVLGQVNVSGSITVTGPNSAQNVSGVLTLTGTEGSVTIQLEASKVRTVIGNRYGPVKVTETVIGATGNGTAVQGESGNGFLGLGSWIGAKHGNKGKTVAAHGSFWLFVPLTSPTS